jgi:hypothetical protein
LKEEEEEVYAWRVQEKHKTHLINHECNLNSSNFSSLLLISSQFWTVGNVHFNQIKIISIFTSCAHPWNEDETWSDMFIAF